MGRGKGHTQQFSDHWSAADNGYSHGLGAGYASAITSTLEVWLEDEFPSKFDTLRGWKLLQPVDRICGM